MFPERGELVVALSLARVGDPPVAIPPGTELAEEAQLPQRWEQSLRMERVLRVDAQLVALRHQVVVLLEEEPSRFRVEEPALGIGESDVVFPSVDEADLEIGRNLVGSRRVGQEQQAKERQTPRYPGTPQLRSLHAVPLFLVRLHPLLIPDYPRTLLRGYTSVL